MQQTLKKTPALVRFPTEMLDYLKKCAEANERTVPGEVIFRIRKTIEAEKEAT
jgi:hypothetical protein